LIHWYRRRRARRAVMADVVQMEHREAARLMRALARAGIGEQILLVALAERSLATSPPEMRPTYERWAQAYRGGRRVKVGTYPAAALLEPAPDEMVRAVDEAFEEGDNYD